ncbi:MAG: IS66 family insertion sequence element accessory protein TnpB [Thermoanaerobaculia bacterium]|nr:IS66 family insertion sequence element accessory protein TnpB [Thermoanaerobaculia bacterium]
MFLDWSRVKIYVRPGVTDLRKQINGLANLVSEGMAGEPLSGNVYLFSNGERRLLKALYWDRNGFCLWHKRLERDRFPWPVRKRRRGRSPGNNCECSWTVLISGRLIKVWTIAQ